MANDTIFDKILAKEIPSDPVYEDEHVYAFNDINPQAPVHVLVVPKHRMTSVADFKDEDAETIGIFLKAVSAVAAKLGLEESGYRVVFNTGDHAQQSVEYVHAHIIGGRQLSWPPG
jgi:histidine triad (HIT) family protein